MDKNEISLLHFYLKTNEVDHSWTGIALSVSIKKEGFVEFSKKYHDTLVQNKEELIKMINDFKKMLLEE